jgi:hypothetical protein
MRLIYLAALCMVSFYAKSEDLNGIWKGTLSQEPGGCYPQYFIELQISFSDNQITGKIYDYYDTSRFIKLSFSGRYNPETHRMLLIENKIIQYSIPADCVPCIKTYDLVYSKKGDEETLEGEWKGHIIERQKTCPPGKILLKKASKSDFSADIPQPAALAEIQEKIHVQSRATNLVKTVMVSVSEIKIDLYDNAEIDNDTISVFINGKLLLYRQMLTDKPLTIHFNAIPDTEYELVMYADNLGLIPPNTALMVVTAGSKKFEVFLSSSEEKSAAARFIYKKPE